MGCDGLAYFCGCLDLYLAAGISALECMRRPEAFKGSCSCSKRHYNFTQSSSTTQTVCYFTSSIKLLLNHREVFVFF